MKNFFVVIIALVSLQISLGQSINSKIVSELNVQTADNVSIVTAKVFNKTDLYYNLKYVFSITTFDENYKPLNKSLEDFLKSKDATAKTLEDFLNSQEANKYVAKESIEDFFTLDPYQSKDLYRESVETGSTNKIIVLLLIYDEEDNIVAKNRIVFNENNVMEETVTKEEIPEDGIELTGLVVEETLTKNGKDFYDQFYFLYSYNNVKGDEIVIIDEMFTFRTRTKINVKIGEQEIFSFFGSSNEEHIDEMAKISVQKVYQYFENKKKEKSYITRY
jgi:hypothetical protein